MTALASVRTPLLIVNEVYLMSTPAQVKAKHRSLDKVREDFKNPAFARLVLRFRQHNSPV